MLFRSGGLSIEKNCIAGYTNHSNYQDFYAQLDYNIGKWGFMAGEKELMVVYLH